MATNKLEELRKRGNFTPQKPFLENNAPSRSQQITKKESRDPIDPDAEKYVPSTNQRKTLKVSPQTKSEIEELKRHLKMGFNYEVIQFLIDNYVNSSMSTAEKRRFRENVE